MASLILAKRLFNLAQVNTFKKAITNSDIIIGGTGKFIFEHKLIANETFIYSIGLAIAQQNYLSNAMLFVGAISSTVIPALRLLKSWDEKTIDIINCEYNQSN